MLLKYIINIEVNFVGNFYIINKVQGDSISKSQNLSNDFSVLHTHWRRAAYN
jgi:hypothetical protein